MTAMLTTRLSIPSQYGYRLRVTLKKEDRQTNVTLEGRTSKKEQRISGNGSSAPARSEKSDGPPRSHIAVSQRGQMCGTDGPRGCSNPGREEFPLRLLRNVRSGLAPGFSRP
jgi:hypothetical protein